MSPVGQNSSLSFLRTPPDDGAVGQSHSGSRRMASDPITHRARSAGGSYAAREVWALHKTGVCSDRGSKSDQGARHMTARNWDRQRERSRTARHGIEPATGLPLPSAPPRMRPSKAELRAEAAAAVSAAGSVTRQVTCRCGRTARITIAAAKLHLPMRCTACRRLIR